MSPIRKILASAAILGTLAGGTAVLAPAAASAAVAAAPATHFVGSTPAVVPWTHMHG